jgi:glyoxylase I family protein
VAIVQMHQVSLCVADLERAVHFYRDLLGCRQVAELRVSGAVACAALGLPPRDVRCALLERDGLRLELLCLADEARPDEAEGREAREPALDARRPRPCDAIGFSHLTFLVDDLRATLHSLRDRGVAIVEHALVEPATGCASGLVRDPDGLAVLLVQQPAGVRTPYAASPELEAAGELASDEDGAADPEERSR